MLIFSVPLAAQDFVVSGSLHSKVYFGPSPEERDTFTITVSGCNWLLHEDLTELKMDGVIQTNKIAYTEASFDGKRYYTVIPVGRSKNHTNPAPFIAIGQVGDGIIPVDTGSHVRDLWLGFASHCYFEHITNEWLYPLFMQASDAAYVTGPFLVKTIVEYPSGSRYLPSTILYTFDFAGTVSQQQGLQDVHGTNAVLVVDEFTNIQSMLVPTRYHVLKYSLNGLLTEVVDVSANVSNGAAGAKQFYLTVAG